MLNASAATHFDKARAFDRQGNYGLALWHWRAAARKGETRARALADKAEKKLEAQRRLGCQPLLPVASVCSGKTYAAWSPQCAMTLLTPDNWRDKLALPAFALIEGTGARQLFLRDGESGFAELKELFSLAGRLGVPTVFWNNEDPWNHELFLPLAKIADYVCSTDYDSLGRYKKELGHSRVYLLPPCARPRALFPLEEIEDDSCIDCDDLAGAAIDPDLFAMLTRVKARHRKEEALFDIALNKEKYSSTVLPARVLEIMGARRLPVCDYGRGVSVLLGRLALASDNETQLDALLSERIADGRLRRSQTTLALRKILSEHTPGHRLARLAHLMEIPHEERVMHAWMIGLARNPAEMAALEEAFERQAWPGKSLVVVTPQDPGCAANQAGKKIYVVSAAQAWAKLEGMSGACVALLSPHDYYGEDYLTDLTLAKGISHASATGKGAYYDYENGEAVLRQDGCQYKLAETLPARRCLVEASAISPEWLEKALANPDLPVPDCFSVDEFSYMRHGAACADAKALADCAANTDTGLSLVDVYQRADAIGPWNVAAKNFAICGADLALPLEQMDDISMSIEGQSLRIEASLGESVKYIYAEKPVPIEESGLANNALARVMAAGDLRGQLVLAFLNEDRDKISHVFIGADKPWRVSIPVGTRYVRPGLRLSGMGIWTLRRAWSEPAPEQAPLMKSGTLLIAPRFPDYDALYNFAFVHARGAAYARLGYVTEYYQLNERPVAPYREFENMDVIVGSFRSLALLLESGQISTFCIHCLTEPLWNFLKPYLEKVKIIVWCHGYEIQPWRRRVFDMEGKSATERVAIKKASHARMAFWRDVFQNSSRLQFVFVSKYFRDEVASDYGVTPGANWHVIHNHIDGARFAYHEKTRADRLHLLSIRPYASRKYANDLTVKAIEALKDKPYFEELHFTLIGDGRLFEDTVASLRQYKNISIKKAFLRWQEIAALHQLHGVVLTPTRMDSQGVSRDEAMSSGLVPITNAVAAIPEFVDPECGFLCKPESAAEIAAAIERIYHEPELFLRMSKNAARKVRALSGVEQTVKRELELIKEPLDKTLYMKLAQAEALVYGDLHPNVLDGSSMWLASTISILARTRKVAVLLKVGLAETNALRDITDRENITLIEPGSLGLNMIGAPAQAARIINNIAEMCPKLEAIIIRGYETADAMIRLGYQRGKIYAYMSAFYRPGDSKGFEIRDELKPMTRRLLGGSGKILMQTKFVEKEFRKFFPAPFAASILPPATPDNIGSLFPRRPIHDGHIHIGYGGKIHPRWGVEELIEWTWELVGKGMKIRLHLAVSKIWRNPTFLTKIRKLLLTPHVTVQYGLSRHETMAMLSRMNFVWCWRPPELENTFLELSTKLVEGAACGLPCICCPSPVNRDFLGMDYLFYCTCKSDLPAVLSRGTDRPVRPDNVKKHKYSAIEII